MPTDPKLPVLGRARVAPGREVDAQVLRVAASALQTRFGKHRVRHVVAEIERVGVIAGVYELSEIHDETVLLAPTRREVQP